jgi:hypothetical protein
MNVTLKDIENAVRRNFVLKPEGEMLETVYDWESNSSQTARLVFVGIAVERGYHMDEVCAFLEMSNYDFHSKTTRFRDYIISGRMKIADMKRKALPLHRVLDKPGADALDMRVYRKAILVNNYLQLMLQTKVFELRRSLPNYVD